MSTIDARAALYTDNDPPLIEETREQCASCHQQW
jgi:hypothetical protein